MPNWYRITTSYTLANSDQTDEFDAYAWSEYDWDLSVLRTELDQREQENEATFVNVTVVQEPPYDDLNGEEIAPLDEYLFDPKNRELTAGAATALFDRM